MAINNFNNDPFNPLLVDYYDYSESVTDIGDVAFKLKYAFLRDRVVDMAVLGTIRIPTGRSDDFLGTGESNTKLTLIASKKTDRFGGHINVGYEKRGGAFDSDELELNFGFEQKFSEGVTFVADFLAELDISNSNLQFPENKVLMAVYRNPPFDTSRTEIEVPVTNIHNRKTDHFLNASLGLKIAVSHWFSGFANILIPLNDGGLRAGIVPTFGLAFTL